MRRFAFSAVVNLQAAQAGKPRRFDILAYNGGKLNVSGFPLPVIVDLQGIDSSTGVQVVLNHEVTDETTIGQADTIQNDGRRLLLAGPITGDHQPRVANAIAQHEKGHKWQASIGGGVDGVQEIAANQSVHVNGQTFTGPVLVARKFEWRETSVLPVGADGGTQVNLAAAAALGAVAMSFEDWVKSLGVEPTTLSDGAKAIFQKEYDATQGAASGEAVAAAANLNLRASHADDLERIGQIQAKFGKSHPLLAAAAIRKGLSINDTELTVLRAERLGNSPNGVARGDGEPTQRNILLASFAMSCGVDGKYLEAEYGKNAVDAATAREHRGAKFSHLIRYCAEQNGERAGYTINDTALRASLGGPQQLMASGPTIISLPGILGNVANKSLLQGYESVRTTWQKFCAIGNLENFHEATRYRAVLGGTYDELPPGGTMKHANMTPEDEYTNKLKTYAKMFSIDRQTFINDDLGIFKKVMPGLGRQDAITKEKQVYTKLLAANATLFTTGRGNRLTGAGTALDIESLAAAEKLFMMLTDQNGDYLMLEPALLLTPPTLSTVAKTLINSTQVVAVGAGDTAATTPSGNPHNGSFERETSPWLENEGLEGHSAAGWYLIAKPMGDAGLMEVGFLNGQQAPTVQQADADFNRLGVDFRGFNDWGIAVQDHRFGVYSEGTPAA